MPTKGTTARAVRISNETLADVTCRAAKKKISVNAWINNAIRRALRK